MKDELFSSLRQGQLCFKDVEVALFQEFRALFQQEMVRLLEAMDEELAATRDVTTLEMKKIDEREVETVFGPVRFKRRYYRDHQRQRWVYLLDEILGLERYDRVSPLLAEMAVLWAVKGPSYRDARDRLADLQGRQVLSHETIRQRVLAVGKQVRRDEQRRCREESGDRKVAALFCEADGVVVSMQRQKQRKREVKLAVVHEGWRRRHQGGRGTEQVLVNPQYLTVTGNGTALWDHLREQVESRYRINQETVVVINGDGAGWIEAGTEEFPRAIYQYDRFHVTRHLRQVLRRQPERKKRAMVAYRKGDIGTMLAEVAEAGLDAQTPEEGAAIDELREALVSRHESLRDYRVRLREMDVEVDQSWRGLGAAESNVNKFSNRLRKRGRSWSEQGLQAMMSCLGHHFEGHLLTSIRQAVRLPEVMPSEPIRTKARKITRRVRELATGTRRGRFPAMDRGTEGYAEIFRQIRKPQMIW